MSARYLYVNERTIGSISPDTGFPKLVFLPTGVRVITTVEEQTQAIVAAEATTVVWETDPIYTTVGATVYQLVMGRDFESAIFSPSSHGKSPVIAKRLIPPPTLTIAEFPNVLGKYNMSGSTWTLTPTDPTVLSTLKPTLSWTSAFDTTAEIWKSSKYTTGLPPTKLSRVALIPGVITPNSDGVYVDTSEVLSSDLKSIAYLVRNNNGSSSIVEVAGATIEIIYDINDQFTVDESAPIPSPRDAIPGPGTLVIDNTSNRYSISDGKLVALSTSSWSGPGYYYSTPITRVPGRLVTAEVTIGTNSFGGASVGLTTTPTFTAYDSPGYPLDFNSNGTVVRWVYGNSSNIPIQTYESSEVTEYAIILRSTGAFILSRVPSSSTSWSLVWVDDTGADSQLYFGGINATKSTYTIDNVKVVEVGGDWETPYGIALTRLTNAPDDATGTHAVNGLLEYTTNYNGTYRALQYRVIDYDNYWYATLTSTRAVALVETTEGVSVTRAQSSTGIVTDSATRKVVISAVENKHTVSINQNVAAITYTDSNNSHLTATTFRVDYATLEEVIAWPRTVTLPNV
jgi:hypothetical protein